MPNEIYTFMVFILNPKKFLARLKHTNRTTRSSSRRKRVNEMESNLESSTSKLKRTLQSETESPSNRDLELHENIGKRRRVKYQYHK